MSHSLSNQEVYDLARKHAIEALAQIASNQLTTWVTSNTDTTLEIVTRQIGQAIDDALLHDRGERKLHAMCV